MKKKLLLIMLIPLIALFVIGCQSVRAALGGPLPEPSDEVSTEKDLHDSLYTDAEGEKARPNIVSLSF
jgi:hypothetical protein